MTRLAVVVSLLLGVLASSASHAQLQGKLFTTPEQRAYLDALRQNFLSTTRETGFDIEESAIPPLPQTTIAESTQRMDYTLGGIMTRRDGSHIIWLNNRSYSEADLPAGAVLVNENNVLALRFRTEAGNKLLLPGQTIAINTGRVQERYQRTVPAPAAETDATAQP